MKEIFVTSPTVEKDVKPQLIEYALRKANEIIPEIDEMLNVEIVDGNIYTKEGEVYKSRCLLFTHSENQSIDWSMEIAQDADYFEKKFRIVLEDVYKKQLENRLQAAD